MMITALNYALILAVLAGAGAALRLRLIKRGLKGHTFFPDVNDTADTEIGELHIEDASRLVSVQTLSKRGSWRVALDQVMSGVAFEDMKAEEYQKKL